MTEKRCSRCGQTKAATEFSPNRHHKDGLSSDCKACRRQWIRDRRQKTGYAENKAALRAYRRLAAAHRSEYLDYLAQERSQLLAEAGVA